VHSLDWKETPGSDESECASSSSFRSSSSLQRSRRRFLLLATQDHFPDFYFHLSEHERPAPRMPSTGASSLFDASWSRRFPKLTVLSLANLVPSSILASIPPSVRSHPSLERWFSQEPSSYWQLLDLS